MEEADSEGITISMSTAWDPNKDRVSVSHHAVLGELATASGARKPEDLSGCRTHLSACGLRHIPAVQRLMQQQSQGNQQQHGHL